MDSLNITSFPIDDDCIGSRWEVADEDQLAKLIAVVVMGQVMHAATLIKDLKPAYPAFSTAALKDEAKIKFTVQETSVRPRFGYPRVQRDGLIFEVISWIAAKQVSGDNCYLKDPHISSTSQGLDGLMIELSAEMDEIVKSTIFEDKCTDNPRKTFREQVIPGFIDRHGNTRNAEIIAAAATLIKLSGVNDLAAMSMVKKVMDNSCRQYRAGFALTSEFDTENARKALFKNFDKLTDISQEQRVGASFIIGVHLRNWFDHISTKIISFIEQLEEDEI